MSTLANRFHEAAEKFFWKTAREHGLGIGHTGTHITEAYGRARALTLYGWKGETSLAVVFGLPDDWQPIGRAYLMWCVQPGAVEMDPRRLPDPIGSQILTTPDELERAVLRGLRWLENRPYAEVQASFLREGILGEQPRGQS